MPTIPAAVQHFRDYLQRRHYAPHTLDSDPLDLQVFFAASALPPEGISFVPGADQAQLRARLLEDAVIGHPSPLPTTAGGRAFIRHLLPQAHQQPPAKLRADLVTQARIDELAAKCNEGELTEAEKREYGAYVEAMDLIGILQAKARTILERSPRG